MRDTYEPGGGRRGGGYVTRLQRERAAAELGFGSGYVTPCASLWHSGHRSSGKRDTLRAGVVRFGRRRSEGRAITPTNDPRRSPRLFRPGPQGQLSGQRRARDGVNKAPSRSDGHIFSGGERTRGVRGRTRRG